ncbi:ZYRO0B02486p [Zygosaccharomyces rouxii]|uniref:ZYRO0B02486p n=1 Tax=Zygosaccharomyces rouxii (strain ATCC 2623 / CBS 732 / NBRC 1130 / NCYC 568 / NRRL Y-229) TaxID=559307 RepID=C5DQR9_ZYGRC|nr:uncharacterized protein ZYRO0B02486g [Zygosaccharomyces rouxii]KAH9200320.1 WD40-repeat-containing domain protein [Zygosaccharomyces rouxii]CAR26130.1 ZYRO0B02486p [Zygosaccharomyces rouxii]
MISATCWVPRGYASEFPEKYELDNEEMERINQMANLNLNDATAEMEEVAEEEEEGAQEEASEESQPNPSKLQDQLDADDDLKEFDMEHYDDEDSGANGAGVAMFPGLEGEDVRFHEGEEGEDPYISLPNKEEQTEEKQELQVYPTDNMVLATRTEDDVSYLDVYIYDDGAGFHDVEVPQEKGDEADPDVARGLVRDSSLYVHHDLMLPAFPLCVEWLNYRPGSQSDDPANFAAIGSFDPQIEIWNLDCVEKAFPDMILGEPEQGSGASLKNKKNKKKQKNQHITTHHTDAILSLALNKHFRAVLASTSADHTVKLWDLNNGTAARSLASIHSGKNVSSSEWHKTNGSVLLTSGYDSRVALSDVRISDESQLSKYWSVLPGEEVESSTFADENIILSGTDSGNVYAFDIRNNSGSKPVWTLNAHDAGISCLCANDYIPGMMTTSAMGDKTVKLWKFPLEQDNTGGLGPSMVLSRDFDVGNVLSVSFANDVEVAGNMAIGGVNTGLKLYDVFSNRTVRKSFGRELSAAQQTAKAEAQQLGKSSRFARKYRGNSQPDTVVTVDADNEEDEDDADEDEE